MRKITCTVLILTVSVMLSACKGTDSGEQAEIEHLTAVIEDLEDENRELKMEIKELEKSNQELLDQNKELQKQKSDSGNLSASKETGDAADFPEGGFQPGYIKDDTYYNESMGLKVKIPAELEFADDEMVAMMQKLSDDTGEEGHVYYDAIIYSGGGSMLRIVAMRDMEGQDAMEYIKEYFNEDYNDINTALLGEDITISKLKTDTVSIGGKEFAHGYVSLDNLSDSERIDQHIYAREAGNYMYFLSLMDSGDATKAYEKLIQSFEDYNGE